MTISVISFKVLVSLPPNMVLYYSIISQSVLWKNRITVFKVKVTANVQNFSVSNCVCSVSPEPFNHFSQNLVWRYIIMRQCVMLQKNWFTIFNVKVTARAYIIVIWLFLLYTLSCWSFATSLVWQYSITSRSVVWKNGITAFMVEVTAEVQNVSEYLSGQYLLNHRTFCYQTWFGYAAS